VRAVSGEEGGAPPVERLAELRRRLDELDARLLDVLARRFDVCREVAAHKAEARIPMMQPGRVAEVKRRAVENGGSRGLDPGFMAALYDLVIAEACRIEDEILAVAPRGPE
jgi:chorismate mutase-like protein